MPTIQATPVVPPASPVAANPAIPAALSQSVVEPGWAQAYQEAQRQTAEAHTAFLQAMAQTHSAYLDTIERVGR